MSTPPSTHLLHDLRDSLTNRRSLLNGVQLAIRSSRKLGWQRICMAVLVACCCGAAASDAGEPARFTLPTREPVTLRKVAKLGPGPGKENSGIVRSRTRPDLYWIHNDSGDEPRIYPVNAQGEDYKSSRYAETPGVLIGDAINVDWEDITIDSAGHVIVADVGNNGNDRRDLVLYYLFEPSANAGRTTLLQKVFVHYPDQPSIPAPQTDFNYDCEAVFAVGTTVHMITKHRSDTVAKLYRLDDPHPHCSNPLTLVDRCDFQGQVVGADASPDGLRLVAITYNSIWLFRRPNTTTSFFRGNVSWAPYTSQQVEAVCFAEGDTIYLADEELGELFVADLSELTPLAPSSGE